jgi:hypothetical protein
MSGNDLVTSNVGNDTVYGGSGSDTFYTSDGKSQMFGGFGVDYFNIGYGDQGTNTIEDFKENDFIVVKDSVNIFESADWTISKSGGNTILTSTDGERIVLKNFTTFDQGDIFV